MTALRQVLSASALGFALGKVALQRFEHAVSPAEQWATQSTYATHAGSLAQPAAGAQQCCSMHAPHAALLPKVTSSPPQGRQRAEAQLALRHFAAAATSVDPPGNFLAHASVHAVSPPGHAVQHSA